MSRIYHRARSRYAARAVNAGKCGLDCFGATSGPPLENPSGLRVLSPRCDIYSLTICVADFPEADFRPESVYGFIVKRKYTLGALRPEL